MNRKRSEFCEKDIDLFKGIRPQFFRNDFWKGEILEKSDPIYRSNSHSSNVRVLFFFAESPEDIQIQYKNNERFCRARIYMEA